MKITTHALTALLTQAKISGAEGAIVDMGLGLFDTADDGSVAPKSRHVWKQKPRKPKVSGYVVAAASELVAGNSAFWALFQRGNTPNGISLPSVEAVLPSCQRKTLAAMQAAVDEAKACLVLQLEPSPSTASLDGIARPDSSNFDRFAQFLQLIPLVQTAVQKWQSNNKLNQRPIGKLS